MKITVMGVGYVGLVSGACLAEDGSADLQSVLAAAASIGRYMTDYKVVVDKSTVPVGTADRVRATIAAALAERGVEVPYAVVSNPEFLKEGAAVEDFIRPDCTSTLKQPVVFDGRNVFTPELARAAGIEYHGIGRAAVPAALEQTR
jgi:UDP-glucose 6-dehydrogenase